MVLGTPLNSKMLLELTAGLVGISIALAPDLGNWGTQVGPLGAFMSPRLAGKRRGWDPVPNYCTVLYNKDTHNAP